MKYNTTVYVGEQKFNVYATNKSSEIETGLMYITELDSNGGMLLSYENPDFWGVWMKNVCIPLDIIWISEEDTVIDKKTLYPSFKNPESTVTYIDKKSKYTLEVNANSFYGEIGDKVFFSEVVE